MTDGQTDWLTDWLTGWSFGWLVDMVGWLYDTFSIIWEAMILYHILLNFSCKWEPTLKQLHKITASFLFYFLHSGLVFWFLKTQQDISHGSWQNTSWLIMLVVPCVCSCSCSGGLPVMKDFCSLKINIWMKLKFPSLLLTSRSKNQEK